MICLLITSGSLGSEHAKNRAHANDVGYQRTVDGDSDTLGESEAILAEEGGVLAQTVGLEVLDGRVGRVNLSVGEVDVVGLSNCLDGSGAGVVLCAKSQNQNSDKISLRAGAGGGLKAELNTYRKGEESTESHCE